MNPPASTRCSRPAGIMSLDFQQIQGGQQIGTPGTNRFSSHEVVAIHDGSLQSLDELNKQLEAPRKNLWNDRDLPFRVALAGSPEGAPTPQGTVIADYGIREFPTTLLIGRDGKLSGRIYPQQGEENLKLIRDLLERE